MKRQKKILSSCIAASLAIHIGFFVFLQTHSDWFNAHEPAEKNFSFSLEKISRDQILKESFAAIPDSSLKYLPNREIVSSSLPHLPFPKMILPPPKTETATASFEDLLSNHLFPIRSFTLPLVQNVNFFADLPKDLIIPSVEPPIFSKLFFPEVEKKSMTARETLPESIPSEALQITFACEANVLPPQEIPKAIPTIPMPALPEVPSLADLETVNLSSAFEVELTFSPRPDGPGYLFALTLIPKEDLQIPTLRQHLIFLIDRSNSIQHERLAATKVAVAKAIEELDAADSFNIIAFDHKMEKLSPSLIKASPDSIAKANEFLNKIQLGSFFSPGDLYRPLFVTIPAFPEDDEVYTAILLTDGEGLSKKGTQETFARDWTLQNQGRVALYALSMETDAHLGTIDAACHFNKGRLIYANSYRGLKRKLSKLTQNIKHPIAKNISFKTISKSPDAKIEIYPNPTAPIYLDQPYVLLGSTDTPDDFILFVQGRLKDQWLNVKKTISFVHAKKGGNFLKSEWALQKAYQQYERYLIEGDQKYLTQAKELLEPFHLQIAFQ